MNIEEKRQSLLISIERLYEELAEQYPFIENFWYDDVLCGWCFILNGTVYGNDVETFSSLTAMIDYAIRLHYALHKEEIPEKYLSEGAL